MEESSIGSYMWKAKKSNRIGDSLITTIVQLEDIEGYRPMFEELLLQVEK